MWLNIDGPPWPWWMTMRVPATLATPRSRNAGLTGLQTRAWRPMLPRRKPDVSDAWGALPRFTRYPPSNYIISWKWTGGFPNGNSSRKARIKRINFGKLAYLESSKSKTRRSLAPGFALAAGRFAEKKAYSQRAGARICFHVGVST